MKKDQDVGIIIDVETIIDLVRDVAEGRTLVIVPSIEMLTAVQSAGLQGDVTFATLQALGPTAVKDGDKIEVVQ